MKTLFPLLILLFCFSCKPIETESIHLDAFDYIDFEVITDKLDLDIRETSGIAKDAYTYWTHNDSGNPSEIHQISESGEIQNKVQLGNYYNEDWEDMTTDDIYLYIGDFGNNFGSRKNLRILKVAKDSLASTRAIVRDTINFKFPDQEIFPGNYEHNFDCESMIAFGDSLYVFTKNWENHATRVYSLPKKEGNYDANLKGHFNTQGIITSAAISPKADKVVLLGYNYTGDMFPFIWVFSDFEGANFFGGKSKRFNLDMKRQTEGIEFMNDSTLVITAEKGQTKAAAMFKVTLK